jgi:hypothetical protein
MMHTLELRGCVSCDTAIEWWTDLTTAGREGMVVKPLDFISKGRRGNAQPAIVCRLVPGEVRRNSPRMVHLPLWEALPERSDQAHYHL